MPPYPTVEGSVAVDIVRGVAVLTLDRPEKLNALDLAMRLRLATVIRELGTGGLVRGIVLTGAGRAFSAGADLQDPLTTDAEVREAFESVHDITRAVLETRVPVVAAVNGLAVGGEWGDECGQGPGEQGRGRHGEGP